AKNELSDCKTENKPKYKSIDTKHKAIGILISDKNFLFQLVFYLNIKYSPLFFYYVFYYI
ncbi:hypothetical protein, partial [Bacillus cereus]|uniref:hypothetical protein n=1 Tax=Bacillus cereus TaxID=1396 RepID=UPI001A7E741B